MPPQPRMARETSSSPQLRAGLLSLPVELVEHILTLSLPDNEEERPAHLALLSLVHKSWKAFAEPLLYRRIVLRSPAAARKLCLTFGASRDGKRLAQMCRVMLLNPAAPDGEYKLKIADEMRVVELLKAVTEMEELEVYHMMTIDVWELIRCPKLRRASLSRCTTVMSLSTRYPRGTSPLTTLSLSHTSVFPKAFPPKAYPHLTSLSLNGCARTLHLGDGCDASAQFVKSVGPRLTRLFTTTWSYHIVADRISSLTSLQALAMQAPDWETLAIPDLPATGSMRYLYLQRQAAFSTLFTYDFDHQTWIKHALRLASLLDTANPSFQNLRAVRLPGKPSVGAVHAREVGEVKARLVQLEEQRMMKIVWSEKCLDSEEEFARFVEEMESER